MSRFGIRRKLRSLVGAGGGGRPEIVQHAVTFVLPDGTEQVVQAEEHYTISMASQALPSTIGQSKGGGSCPDGACGECTVEVLDGTGLSAKSDSEKKRLAEQVKNATDNTRLSCHARIQGPGARIQVTRLFDYATVQGDPNGT